VDYVPGPFSASISCDCGRDEPAFGSAIFVPYFHTVEMYGRLCLECRGCRKRAWKTAEELGKASRQPRAAAPLSDMTNIDALPFRCRGCKPTSARLADPDGRKRGGAICGWRADRDKSGFSAAATRLR